MATLIQYLPFDITAIGTYKAMSQGFGNALSTFGWVPSSDSGILNSTGNYGTATITNVAIANNVLQITYSGATQQFAAGETVQLSGLTTNTFLNGQIVRITDATQNQNAFSLNLASVATSVGSTAVYTMTNPFFDVPTNFFANTVFVVTGFTNSVNNGTFVCTASTTNGTTNTLTLYNSAATSETHAATAVQQNDRTNSLFTALFTHADVSTLASPGADTGTVTAIYNWNTVTAPGDRTDTTYTKLQPKRFRGAWVGATPTFTQLQTTNNQTTLTFGANGHGLHTTFAVGQGLRVTAVTNANFTWLNDNATGLPNPGVNDGQVAYGGWPIVSLTSTTIVINTQGSPRADIAATPVTAGYASPYYLGGQSGTASVNDLVMYGGDLYEFINGTTRSFNGNNVNSISGGLWGFQGIGGGGGGFTNNGGTSVFTTTYSVTAVANASAGTTVYTVSGLNSTNFYVGMYFTFTGFASAANNGTYQVTAATTTTLTVNNPNGVATGTGTARQENGFGAIPGTDTTIWKRVLFEVWTSNDSLSTTNKIYFKIQYGVNQTTTPLPDWTFWAGTNTDGNINVTQNSIWGSATPTSALSTSIISMSGNALWECDFSGDSGRFTCIMWRTYNVGAATPALVVNIERAHDNSGNNLDTYWTILWNQAPAVNLQVSVLKPGTGGAGILESNNTNTIKTIGANNAQSFNNNIAILPVFPIIGFVGNPFINIIAMKGGDAAEGGFLSTTFYGTTHSYLMSKAGNGTTGGPANFGQSTANTMACGIRWE